MRNKAGIAFGYRALRSFRGFVVLLCQPACEHRLTAAVLLLFSAMGPRGAASALIFFWALSLSQSNAHRRKPKLEQLSLEFKPWPSLFLGSGHLPSLPPDRGDGKTLSPKVHEDFPRDQTSAGPGARSTDGPATVEGKYFF